MMDFARTAARVAAGIGLLLLFCDLILVTVTDGVVRPPDAVWQAGLILTTAGCWALALTIARWFAPWERLGSDVALGVLGLLAGLVTRAAASLPRMTGHGTFVVIALFLLFAGSLGVLAACWRSARRVKRMDRENPIT